MRKAEVWVQISVPRNQNSVVHDTSCWYSQNASPPEAFERSGVDNGSLSTSSYFSHEQKLADNDVVLDVSSSCISLALKGLRGSARWLHHLKPVIALNILS